ncbi:thioredoxin [Verrucomicrobia bacterium]|jgi:thioredoxin 1|nr:thioredoxin [Pedosphaera sp.]MBL6843959.1 thioredoxin [Verrucomicrobiae bacterium]MDA7509942.1 thioredoxin [bacterium]MDB4704872.1 thioredoxin [Verrucomicrobiota bacterium]RZO70734.1 MAG: thioredoxin [Limisphaerales bacterium]HAO68129.1 thioredoxin [Verrucomicrobiales bacterium]|tara:strand:- start:438 stop:755 length:318 start_codon:yes stop_codon:yes gene_type:complete
MESINEANFDEKVIQSSSPALVDFWAEWCGPCKMLTPVLEELSSENESKINIYKVNVDENQQLAVKYGIRSIPTLLLFKGGEIQEQIVGLKSKSDLQTSIDSMAD